MTHVLQEAFHAVLQAADIYVAIYPEDLFPHPATFYDALSHGCALLATPFKAAIGHMPRDAGKLAWSTAPDDISRQLGDMLDSERDVLASMQQAAWRESHRYSWQRSAQAMLQDVLSSVVVT